MLLPILQERLQADDEDHSPARGLRTPRDLKCRLREATDREAAHRVEIDKRLAVHRADASRPKLGLDRLVSAHRLAGAI